MQGSSQQLVTPQVCELLPEDHKRAIASCHKCLALPFPCPHISCALECTGV